MPFRRSGCVRTSGSWGTYTPEQRARAAHLRENPGDVYWAVDTPAGAPRPRAPALDGLPSGWTCTVRHASARDYKVYIGPNGEQAPSIPQVWLKHNGGGKGVKRRLAAPAPAPAPAPAAAPLPPRAADDVPPGWTCEVRYAKAKDYKVYTGPDGKHAYSNVEAWRQYESAGGAAPAPPPTLPPDANDMQRRYHAYKFEPKRASGERLLLPRTQPRKPPHPEEKLHLFPVLVPPSSYTV